MKIELTGQYLLVAALAKTHAEHFSVSRKVIMSCSVKEIITDRLVIRPHMLEDVSVINDAQKRSFSILNPWMEWAKEIPSLENTSEFVQFSLKMWSKEKPENLPFIVFERKSNEFVGGAGYVSIDWEVPSVEIGYWRDIKHPQKGYITEAANALTRYAFDELKANRVQICCDADNIASRRVPERLKFDLEAKLKNHRVKQVTKELADTLVFAIYDTKHLPNLDVGWKV